MEQIRPGDVLHPWAGEALTGVVYAISGEMVLCRTSSGQRFEVRLEDVLGGRCGKVLTDGGITAYHTTDAG